MRGWALILKATGASTGVFVSAVSAASVLWTRIIGAVEAIQTPETVSGFAPVPALPLAYVFENARALRQWLATGFACSGITI